MLSYYVAVAVVMREQVSDFVVFEFIYSYTFYRWHFNVSTNGNRMGGKMNVGVEHTHSNELQCGMRASARTQAVI